ncbi:MAG: ABC transporter substrate-binding protein [Halobacteriales archaeon]|nr:ABC transporter substrate-binding protein [Halobacteriales archaeon]
MQRLVSLAPSATSTIQALGAADRLVGVTAHDDVEGTPAVGGWLSPDLDRLDGLAPDLVLTADPLQRDVRDAVEERGHASFHHEPATLADVLEGFEAVGEAVGLADAGAALSGDARARIDRVDAATPDEPADRPVVYCEEWPDPPMAAGNWVPEAVEAAGGRYPFADPGARSAEVGREAVVDADPEHVVIHHCGIGERASADVAERWGLDAAVHVVDDSLLNQPSPRLVDGIELLAERFHGIPRSPSPLGLKA